MAAGGPNSAYPNCWCLSLNEKTPKKMLAKNIISDTIKKNHPALSPYFNFFCIVYLQKLLLRITSLHQTNINRD